MGNFFRHRWAFVSLLLLTSAHAHSADETVAVEARPPAEPRREGGASLIEDKNFELRTHVLAQPGVTVSLSSPMQSFDIYLARLAFAGHVIDPKFTYFFQLQGSTLIGPVNEITLLDGWLGYQPSPEFNVKLGRLVLPYSLQYYTHPGMYLFADISLTDYGFDLPRTGGLQVGGKMGRFAYDFVLMTSVRALDGVAPNTAYYPGGLVRFGLDILEPYGYIETKPEDVGSTELTWGVALALNPVAENSAFQNTRVGDYTTNLTTDMGFRVDRFGFQGAVYLRKTDWVANAGTGLDRGFYLQSGYYLVPKDLEVALRWANESFIQRPDLNLAAGVGNEYTAGLNYYVKGHTLKLQSDFIYSTIDRFAGGTQMASRVRIQGSLMF